HLVRYEQFREAAQLLAFALPHMARGDARVRAIADQARALADSIEDPDKELRAHYLRFVEKIDDATILRPSLEMIPPRHRYLAMVARLRGAGSVVEFGCGNAAPLMQTAQFFPGIAWLGVDVSEEQAFACCEQADRLGIANVAFAVDPEERVFGKSDCVAVLDVLEHTVHPHEVLSKAERYARPGGIVCVTIPEGAWAPHEDGPPKMRAGAHVAVSHMATLYQLLSSRGEVLHADRIAGHDRFEANASVTATYVPRTP
ncbi:MAG: class I SAM-dependent methyltransferase, partial [Dehalococcoidia bacterium]|nr:class I SAM-dependent methyltransferase [Dehalococcoidia bacterium]